MTPGAVIAGPPVDEAPVVLDRDVLALAGGRVLLGGDPGRLVRLSAGGPAAVQRLAGGGPLPAPVRALAATLLEGGLAHRRPAPAAGCDVAVVIPVRDRTAELARCLSALGRHPEVVVVDDGSRDPRAVARVCAAHGVRVVHLPVNVGPGAARDVGLAATTGELVAFLDSDCVPDPGWLAVLAGHFADPGVGAAAPRVRAAPRDASVLARYAAARGPLDMGGREALVRPGGRVPYVPTAALVVRRSALGGRPAFDPALRFGEDVDLVWRLHDAGWRVRYDPRTVVGHGEPERWSGWLRRRHAYGTSAAPLSARHGRRLTPLVLPPWPTACWLLVLARQPAPALLAAAVPALRLHRHLRRAGVDRPAAARAAATVVGRGVVGTAAGFGAAGTVVTGPLLLALLVPRRTRAAAAVALLAPVLLEWAERRPALDPVRWSAARLADDVAYASGVWRGCVRARTLTPLRARRTRPS